ncbi:Putative phage protein [Gluconobacter oxydans 621H]|uniref:Putative phage protein n=1 Tax=Gluconobacter oxydans (strain 621H) TaxID=290633 RepID=Q5FNI1_GLUOX|nr:DUF6362 family protein [Gluconobacter oxydans]AAW62066.1 Putative phage protein [Gluconobacter oxydans 621H]
MKGIKRIDLGRDVPEQVADWLNDAAFTLAAMPASGCWPGGMRSYWPDIVADRDDLDWPMESDIRPPMPTSDEVSRMDLALSWVPMVADRGQKAVVNMRLIVHPISGQHRWTWRKIGRKLGIHHETAKDWHAEACVGIGRKIRDPAFFSSHFRHFEHM